MNDGTAGHAPFLPESPAEHDVPAKEPQVSPGCYRFDSFEFDGRRRELRRHGLKIHLKGRPFTLLKVLVESEGRVVTREELRGHLWSSDTHVDFDANLTTAFYKVRKALGDSSKDSKFIETIPGQGYRFIEPVVPIAAETAAVPNAALASDAGGVAAALDSGAESRKISPTGRRLISGTIAALVLIVIACAGYIRVLSSSAARARSVRVLVLPFADAGGSAADDNFCDGLNDELITELTRQHGSEFSVIARTTAMTYKNTGKSVQDIARELKVNYVVEGAVQRDDGRVRISARLVRAADQSEIWAETYDRPMGDALDIEFDVAGRIGEALSARVIPRLPSSDSRSLHSRLSEASFGRQRSRWQASATRFPRETSSIPKTIDIF